MDKTYYTYILAGKRNETLYVGVTSDLTERISKHRNGLTEGISGNTRAQQLVYFELHLDIASAMRRKKRLTEWQRKWKLALIEIDNPEWRDLYSEVQGSTQ